MKEVLWVAALNGMQVIAVQHGCGVGGAPVNCYRDEHDNWTCPNCMEVYGAAIPLAEWGMAPVVRGTPGAMRQPGDEL